MQFALTISPAKSKPVSASPDAPRYAQCVYCGMPVELHIPLEIDPIERCYSYQHTSDLSAVECQQLRDRAQEELERVLNVR